MRTALPLAFLLSFYLTGSWADLRIPKSFSQVIDSTTAGDYKHRDLFPMLFGGCQRSLSTCPEAAGGVTDLPTEAWIAQLESMDPSNSDPYVVDLKEIVLRASQSETDFESFLINIKNNRNIHTLVSLFRQARALDGLQPDQLIENMTEILVSLKDMARQAPGFLDVLVYALEFAARLLEFLFSDPGTIDIIVFVLKEIATFIATFIVPSLRVAFVRADANCAAQVIQCSYNQMMVKVVPSLMQGVALAEGLPSGVDA